MLLGWVKEDAEYLARESTSGPDSTNHRTAASSKVPGHRS